MDYTGINMGNVKNRNRSLILRLLNDSGPTSRKDIAARLELAPATVTMLCTELLQEGILRETGIIAEENRAGRRKIRVDINYEYRHVLAISIEADVTTISVCNLRGDCCVARTLETARDEAPEVFLRRVADASMVLMWEQNIGPDRLLGAGVSVPGPVDRAAGISRHAYRIWDTEVPVCVLLEQGLHCRVVLENNVRAFARAELTYGVGRSLQNLVFVKWGPGVGSAIVAERHVYEGQTYKSAEIGHIRVVPNGELCHCGRRGCLETCVATHPIIRRIQAVCTREATPRLWEMAHGDPASLTVHDLEAITELQEERVTEVLREETARLAQVVGGILTMLAPDQLILFGRMFHLPGVKEELIAQCGRYDALYDENYITMSELDDRISYIGPLAAAVSALFFQEE